MGLVAWGLAPLTVQPWFSGIQHIRPFYLEPLRWAFRLSALRLSTPRLSTRAFAGKCEMVCLASSTISLR
jgi:hypothetical protein